MTLVVELAVVMLVGSFLCLSSSSVVFMHYSLYVLTNIPPKYASATEDKMFFIIPVMVTIYPLCMLGFE